MRLSLDRTIAWSGSTENWINLHVTIVESIETIVVSNESRVDSHEIRLGRIRISLDLRLVTHRTWEPIVVLHEIWIESNQNRSGRTIAAMNLTIVSRVPCASRPGE